MNEDTEAVAWAAIEHAAVLARQVIMAMEKHAITNASGADGFDVTGYLLELAEPTLAKANEAFRLHEQSNAD